jgi:uncharacterized repeat protein (TIGR04138 family)
VRSTADIGDVVFNLIERKLLVAGAEDNRTQFEDVFDFHEAFDRAFLDGLERDPPRVSAPK